ncbi:MAG: hypothetical protein KAS85_07085 [Rhodobacteraceae bacterium]|nr:hypothetical protein [Paracoccaceae bacterium]
MRSGIYLAALVFAASAVNAEETQTAEVEQSISEISALYSSLEGKTITMRGAIGTFISDTLLFKNDMGQFTVQFDAGRSARKRTEGCELEWFGWQNSSCLFEVDAEIAFDSEYSFSNGREVKLIIYEVRDY